MARGRDVWHREDIKAELRKRFGTMAALGIGWGYNRRAATNARSTSGHSRRIELRIADALGETPWKLWPDRWGSDGVPLPRNCPIPDRIESKKKDAA